VDFKNTIVIMTSNAQRDELTRLFRPEFLNRVDEIITFHRLDETHLKKIVGIQLEGLKARLAERRIEIQLSDAAKERLIRVGYDPAYGARPLKRAIQKEVETPLARKIVAGEIHDGSKVRVDEGKDGLTFESESSVSVKAS
jgi:ATP-dependent Clp protease ATP-binding subunit ClpB